MLAAGIACRALFQGVWRLPGTPQVEGWLFRPDATSPLLALALAAWLLWRRRDAIAPEGARPRPALAAVLLALSAAGFLWSHWLAAEWLLLPALATSLWGLAAARSGSAGLRATLLPGLVLALGMPLPAPLRAETVWALQRLTTEGAAALLALLGRDVSAAGVLIRSEGHAFLVVEECSGLRALVILLMVAIAVRELCRGAGARSAWLLALVPPLALALNVLRVAWVATAANPARAAADHASQGMAVIAAGTALLYAAGWWMARRAPQPAAPPAPPGAASRTRVARLAFVFWSSLAAASLLLAPLPTPAPPSIFELPTQGAGWRATELEVDPFFQGLLPLPSGAYRRYRRDGPRAEIVELFATYEVADNRASQLFFSRKARIPERDWETAGCVDIRLWALDHAGVRCETRRPHDGDRALVYVLRWRDRGLLVESVLSLLGWDRSPFASARPRLVMRLATPLDGRSELARRTLDRFVHDFQDALSQL